jgi:hypothetical protein
MVSPIVAPPDPRGPWFVKTWIYIISGSFHVRVNMSSSGLVVLEKFFFQYKHIEIWFSLLWPLPTPQGPWFVLTWIYIISESFLVNMSSSGSAVLEKKIFEWPHLIFAFLWLSPLWKGPGPWFVQFWNPFT